MNLKAVLFDKDGVIIDTEPIVYNNTKHVLEKFGKPELTYEEFRSLSGLKSEDVVAQLIKKFEIKITVEEFRELRRQFAGDVFETVPKIEGAIEFVKRLREKGILTGIGTGASRIMTEKTLGSDINLFDAIITADDVTFGKPHPETWLKGAEILGVKSEECIVIGDSKTDMQSAKEARMKTVFLDREGNSLEADLVIKSFSELTVENLQSL